MPTTYRRPPDHPSALLPRSRLTDRHRQILTAIREAGSISRSQLMKRVALSGTAVFRGTEDLAAMRLIAVGETVAEGRGQPSAIVRIAADAVVTLGLSIMTDRAEVVLMDLSGTVRASREVTRPGMGRAAIFDAVETFAHEAMADHGLARGALIGIGIAIAGYFVAPSTVNPAADLDDWALIDLEDAASARFGIAAVIENVASASTVGESLLGVGTDHASFAYLSIASGFGAGIIRARQLVRGEHGNAGEVAGLFPLADRTIPNLSTLRDTLAAHGIVTRSIADLIRHYDDAWPGIDAWVDEHAASFSYLASALRYVLDCGAIVIGGRIPRPLAARIAARIAWPESAIPPRRGRGSAVPAVVVARLPAETAATIGAATLVLRKDYFS